MKISAEIIISMIPSIYYQTYCEAQGQGNNVLHIQKARKLQEIFELLEILELPSVFFSVKQNIFANNATVD